jgi:hypothetical protein
MLLKIFGQCVSVIVFMVAVGVGLDYLFGGSKEE